MLCSVFHWYIHTCEGRAAAPRLSLQHTHLAWPRVPEGSSDVYRGFRWHCRWLSLWMEDLGYRRFSDGPQALCEWGENVTVLWDSQHLTCNQVLFTCWLCSKQFLQVINWVRELQKEPDSHVIHSHLGGKTPINLSWRLPNAIPSALKGVLCFLIWKTAVIFPDSLIREKQIAENAFVFQKCGGRKGVLSKKLHIPHIRKLSPSIRRSYPHQIVARHSWGWSESEFILGASRILLCEASWFAQFRNFPFTSMIH